ncbi:hypothetical protein QRD38_11330 [Leptospira weilii]|uniref:hypothetical protein n=1 Tax=Leptospira weilii TaxID=28184 RepID=UPI00256EA172|nr:hypothetical protein [Leptospira weilii]MDL5246367.1 hypothetical protein [Leptospira weilii]
MNEYRSILYIFLLCSLTCVFIEDKIETQAKSFDSNCSIYRFAFSGDSDYSGMYSKNSWLYRVSLLSDFEHGINQGIEDVNETCRRQSSNDTRKKYTNILLKSIMTQQNPDEMAELRKNVITLFSAATLFLIPSWNEYYYKHQWSIGAGTKCQKTFETTDSVTVYIGIIYFFVPWKWDSALLSTPIESKFYKQTLDIISEYETACSGQI